MLGIPPEGQVGRRELIGKLFSWESLTSLQHWERSEKSLLRPKNQVTSFESLLRSNSR